jgi:hypothetical protein
MGSQRFTTMSIVELVPPMSNREFLERFAQPGRVGLVAGATWVDKAIRLAERHVDPSERSSLWSHAMLFEGRRADGHHWVIESDLEIHRKHIRLGVQENRVAKYFDEKTFPTLAILEGLEMVAGRVRYSLRELVGTLVGLHHPGLRGRDNPLAREQSSFCSAFVQHVFRRAGLDLAPGLDEKHTTPEDISRTPVPHVTYLLRRTEAFRNLRLRLRRRLRRLMR